MKKYTPLSWLIVITSGLIFAGIFGPWLSYEGHTYTLPGYFLEVYHVGGIVTYASQNGALYLQYAFLILPLIACILYGINTVCLLCNHEVRWTASVGKWLLLGYVGGYFTFAEYLPQVSAVSTAVLCLVHFLLVKYEEQRQDINEQYMLLKAREEEARKERERRLLFPGKYPGYFYRIIGKYARYHFSNHVLLMVSGMVSSCFLFLIFALQFLFRDIHEQEMFLIGNGMQRITVEAIGMALVITVFLTSISFSYYVKNKLQQERIFIMMGIREKTLRTIRVVEYIGCMILALLLGLLTGNIVLCILQRIILGRLRLDALELKFGQVDVHSYLYTAVIYLVITLTAAAVNYEIFNRIKFGLETALPAEKKPVSKKIARILGVLGAVAAAAAIYLFYQRERAEAAWILVLFCFGIVLILFFVLMESKKALPRSKSICHYILRTLSFDFHFRTNFKFMVALSVTEFAALFLFAFGLAGELAAPPLKEAFPYDFVCMAGEEDSSYFDALKERYDLQMDTYPMVRVTAVQGDAFSIVDMFNNAYLSVMWPQGQHVGISETTYQQLRAARYTGSGADSPSALRLTGSDLHIVYQQDLSYPAHPLDWYMAKETPHLRIGQPLRYYNWVNRERIYQPYTVQSEEKQILTGMFGRGMQENLVVFSDSYFSEIYQQMLLKNQSGKDATGEERELYELKQSDNLTDGPTRLVLLQCETKLYEEVEEALASFQDLHQLDMSWDEDIRPYYGRKQMLADMETERYLKTVIQGYLLGMLLICTILLMYLKFLFELPEIKKKFDALHCLGMKDKELSQALTKEILLFVKVPFFVSNIGTAIFLFLACNVRMYQMAEVAGIWKCFLFLWIFFWLAHFAGVLLLRKVLFHKVLKAYTE